MPNASPLEAAIWQTVQYFDALALPLTPVQIWRGLVREGTGLPASGVRLADIVTALETSPYLQERLVAAFGYWAPASSAGRDVATRQRYVRARLRRHVLAQHKWQQLRRMSVLLAAVPFVRMAGGSGSLALYNTTWMSDLDVFIVARTGRIWTARLALLLLVQLLGRRRKYGETHAPDKVCLNHYVTEQSLAMAADNRSLYTALQFRRLVFMWGQPVWEHWQAANAAWLHHYLTVDPVPLALSDNTRRLPGRQSVRLPRLLAAGKQQIEHLLLEAPGDVLERWAARVQRRAAGRHTHPQQRGRIVLSDAELAFHPDSRAGGA